MTYAYDELYLECARRQLACMFDYVVYDLEFELNEFIDMFSSSSLAKRIENGDTSTLAGKSGIDIAHEVIEETIGKEMERKPRFVMNRSEEYWLGWALSYYQWKTNMPFHHLFQYVSVESLLSLYSPYHEMDIHHFVDKVNEMYLKSKLTSNLKLRRLEVGLSQKELAEAAKIPIRTLQQYEQRQKNINKAQVEYVYNLSKVLYCDIGDILEYVI